MLRSQKYELLFRYSMTVNENELCAPPHMVVVVVTVFEPWTPFLVEQLQSISNQSFMDFNCVVAFDGPIDQQVLNECTYFPPSLAMIAKPHFLNAGSIPRITEPV